MHLRIRCTTQAISFEQAVKCAAALALAEGCGSLGPLTSFLSPGRPKNGIKRGDLDLLFAASPWSTLATLLPRNHTCKHPKSLLNRCLEPGKYATKIGKSAHRSARKNGKIYNKNICNKIIKFSPFLDYLGERVPQNFIVQKYIFSKIFNFFGKR